MISQSALLLLLMITMYIHMIHDPYSWVEVVVA